MLPFEDTTDTNISNNTNRAIITRSVRRYIIRNTIYQLTQIMVLTRRKRKDFQTDCCRFRCSFAPLAVLSKSARVRRNKTSFYQVYKMFNSMLFHTIANLIPIGLVWRRRRDAQNTSKWSFNGTTNRYKSELVIPFTEIETMLFIHD